MDFAAELRASPVIAIIRGVRPDEVLAVCESLIAGGIRWIEIPLNSPEALTSVVRAAARFGNGRPARIGAGTVLTPAQVQGVRDAGGEYVISPNVDPAVIARTKELGLVSIPGFLTPTEAFAALAAGADALKCFPFSVFGTGYLKDLRAVLDAPLLAVGGVSAENVGEVLKVAAGVGVGSHLYKPGLAPEEIRRRAEAYMQALRG